MARLFGDCLAHTAKHWGYQQAQSLPERVPRPRVRNQRPPGENGIEKALPGNNLLAFISCSLVLKKAQIDFVIWWQHKLAVVGIDSYRLTDAGTATAQPIEVRRGSGQVPHCQAQCVRFNAIVRNRMPRRSLLGKPIKAETGIEYYVWYDEAGDRRHDGQITQSECQVKEKREIVHVLFGKLGPATDVLIQQLHEAFNCRNLHIVVARREEQV